MDRYAIRRRDAYAIETRGRTTSPAHERAQYASRQPRPRSAGETAARRADLPQAANRRERSRSTLSKGRARNLSAFANTSDTHEKLPLQYFWKQRSNKFVKPPR